MNWLSVQNSYNVILLKLFYFYFAFLLLDEILCLWSRVVEALIFVTVIIILGFKP